MANHEVSPVWVDRENFFDGQYRANANNVFDVVLSFSINHGAAGQFEAWRRGVLENPDSPAARDIRFHNTPWLGDQLANHTGLLPAEASQDPIELGMQVGMAHTILQEENLEAQEARETMARFLYPESVRLAYQTEWERLAQNFMDLIIRDRIEDPHQQTRASLIAKWVSKYFNYVVPASRKKKGDNLSLLSGLRQGELRPYMALVKEAYSKFPEPKAA